jgi:hypothetical protein
MSSWKEGERVMITTSRAEEQISQRLSEITPAKILAVVKELLAQAPEDEQGAPLHAIVDRLLADQGVDEAARVRLTLPLRRVVLRAIRQMPELGCSGSG